MAKNSTFSNIFQSKSKKSTGSSQVMQKINRFILAPSRAYIIEHIAVLLTLALLSVVSIGMFNAVLGHFVETDGGLGSFFTYQTLVVYLSVGLVALPAFLLFYVRTRRAERAHPQIRDSKARRKLGYVFQVVAALFIVGYAVTLMYTVLFELLSPVGSSNDTLLITVFSQIFAIKMIAFVATFVSRMSTEVKIYNNMPLSINQFFVVVITSVVAVLMLMVVLLPLQEQRNAAIDEQIADDFQLISSQVNQYHSEEQVIPEELTELELSDAVKERAEAYNYSISEESTIDYQLCADFKTDTTSSSDGEDGFELSFFYPPLIEHSAGNDCVDYSINDSWYGFDQSPLEQNDFNLDGLSEELLNGSEQNLESEVFSL